MPCMHEQNSQPGAQDCTCALVGAVRQATKLKVTQTFGRQSPYAVVKVGEQLWTSTVHHGAACASPCPCWELTRGAHAQCTSHSRDSAFSLRQCQSSGRAPSLSCTAAGQRSVPRTLSLHRSQCVTRRRRTSLNACRRPRARGNQRRPHVCPRRRARSHGGVPQPQRRHEGRLHRRRGAAARLLTRAWQPPHGAPAAGQARRARGAGGARDSALAVPRAAPLLCVCKWHRARWSGVSGLRYQEMHTAGHLRAGAQQARRAWILFAGVADCATYAQGCVGSDTSAACCRGSDVARHVQAASGRHSMPPAASSPPYAAAAVAQHEHTAHRYSMPPAMYGSGYTPLQPHQPQPALYNPGGGGPPAYPHPSSPGQQSASPPAGGAPAYPTMPGAPHAHGSGMPHAGSPPGRHFPPVHHVGGAASPPRRTSSPGHRSTPSGGAGGGRAYPAVFPSGAAQRPHGSPAHGGGSSAAFPTIHMAGPQPHHGGGAAPHGPLPLHHSGSGPPPAHQHHAHSSHAAVPHHNQPQHGSPLRRHSAGAHHPAGPPRAGSPPPAFANPYAQGGSRHHAAQGSSGHWGGSASHGQGVSGDVYHAAAHAQPSAPPMPGSCVRPTS